MGEQGLQELSGDGDPEGVGPADPHPVPLTPRPQGLGGGGHRREIRLRQRNLLFHRNEKNGNVIMIQMPKYYKYYISIVCIH